MVTNWLRGILRVLDNSQHSRSRVLALLCVLIIGASGIAALRIPGVWLNLISALVTVSVFNLLLILFEIASDATRFRRFRRFFFGFNKPGRIHLIFTDFE